MKRILLIYSIITTLLLIFVTRLFIEQIGQIAVASDYINVFCGIAEKVHEGDPSVIPEKITYLNEYYQSKTQVLGLCTSMPKNVHRYVVKRLEADYERYLEQQKSCSEPILKEEGGEDPLIVDWYGQDGYTDVSLLSLLTNPRAYDGQKVCVDAYYLTDGYECSELCLGERWIPGPYLHLSAPRYVDLTPWHGKYIRVRGTFRGRNSLHTCILMYESMKPSRVKNPEETLESMRRLHDANRRGTPPKGIPLP